MKNNDQIPNSNHQTIINDKNSNILSKNNSKFDLEERTFNFSKKCRDYTKNLPKTLSNIEYSQQLIRSSGSVASNYIEANES